MGWKLDISKVEKEEVGFEARIKAAIAGWHGVTGISDSLAEKLVAMGIINPEAFVDVESKDLVDGGFSEEEAGQTIETVNTYRQAQKI